MKHLVLVGNPTAQSGKNAARIERARELFAARGIEAELLPTLPEGKTIAAVAARLARAGDGAIVAMGGDGTFREVAAGIVDSGRAEQVVMGMLPTGTANDQGKSFGLAASEDALARNVEVVVAGHEGPFFYWIALLFHIAILFFLVYVWSTGLRMPISELFE